MTFWRSARRTTSTLSSGGGGPESSHRSPRPELGVRYFDTAPLYGRGLSQAILGEALQDRTEEYLLATKVGRFRTPEHFRSVDAIRAQLDENLRLLRRSEVDVLQMHEADWHAWWSDAPHEGGREVQRDTDYDFANAPVMRLLRETVVQGRCRAIGVTGNSAADTAHVLR